MAGLFTHPDCAPAHGVAAGRVLSLTSPVQEDGVTLFRKAFDSLLAAVDAERRRQDASTGRNA